MHESICSQHVKHEYCTSTQPAVIISITAWILVYRKYNIGCGFDSENIWTSTVCGSSQTPVDYVYTDDGCHSEDGDYDASNDYEIACTDISGGVAYARCCSSDGSTCISPDDCPSGTYDEISQVCQDLGYRLCTHEEMESDICCGTGLNCMFANLNSSKV